MTDRELMDRYHATRYASQGDCALVCAMAAQALEDAALIEGAQLTEREFRALVQHVDGSENPEVN